MTPPPSMSSSNVPMSHGHSVSVDKSPSCGRLCSKRVQGNLLLAGIVLVYLVIGTVVFIRLEESHEEEAKSTLEKEREDIVRGLERDLNISGSNLSIVIYGYLDKFEKTLAEAQDEGVRREDLKWTYGKAFMLSVTTISTVGYGDVSPITKEGRLFCIFYSIIGIPLFLLYLTSCGSVLVKAIERDNKKEINNVWQEDAEQNPGFERRRQGEIRPGRAVVKGHYRTEGLAHTDMLVNVGDTSLQKTSKTVADTEYDSTFFNADVSTKTDSVLYFCQRPRENSSATARADERKYMMEEVVLRPNWLVYELPCGIATKDKERRRYSEAPPPPDSDEGSTPFRSKAAWILPSLFLIYITATSIGIYFSEPYWGVVDSFYYCIVTFTTIGYGDLVLTENNKILSRDDFLRPFSTSLFIIIGLILLSACFTLAQEKIVDCAKALFSKFESCRPVRGQCNC
ncbi:potassium channel subfamily K member 18-like [Ptychodera flava]|uniref:potassium channel subfamily K member 18-like n=1 Tax=Ptychodera flava TaxID=63121 RepID=UPI00396A81E2